eukprot:CAMPEP_0198150260 /NCGR_PEP_ID=MMETSP1443-20131203/50084_1 /TAXON_ID=186043 /ORGANISM="Entomoneis sp., Strain CCMP2396" /LENGTH=128 /DNA_ID=CAMNT_0043815523 /DNA_START=164 /DNA_END=550 /DNA_ORIENTATION=-
MSQPDGGYPRLNAKLLSSGQFPTMIVSLVGKFVPNSQTGNNVEFMCCDDGRVSISLEHVDQAPDTSEHPDQPFELIGQVIDNGSIAMFVARTLSSDTDLPLYNQMIEVQHDSKFEQYFGGFRTAMETS